MRSRVEWATRFAPGLPKNFIVSSSSLARAPQTTREIRVVSLRRIARERGSALTRLENSSCSRAHAYTTSLAAGESFWEYKLDASISRVRRHGEIDAWLTVNPRGVLSRVTRRRASYFIACKTTRGKCIASPFRFRSKHPVPPDFLAFSYLHRPLFLFLVHIFLSLVKYSGSSNYELKYFE